MGAFENGVSYFVQEAESVRRAFDIVRETYAELSDQRRFYVRNAKRPQPLESILLDLQQQPAPDLRAPRGALSVYCAEGGSYVFAYKEIKDLRLLSEQLSLALFSLDGFVPPSGLHVAQAPLWEPSRVCEIRGLEGGVALTNLSDKTMSHVTYGELRNFRVIDNRESIDALIYGLREKLDTHVSYVWDPEAKQVLYIEGRVVRSRGDSALELVVKRIVSEVHAVVAGGEP